MIEVFRATNQHIDILIRLRLDFLKEEMEVSKGDECLIRDQLDEYLKMHLPREDFFAILVKQGAEIASCAFLVVHQMPASPSFVSGQKATLLNVYTYPQFRRQGYARMAVVKAIEDVRASGVSIIDLSATQDGLLLYRQLGFKESDYTSMRLKL